MGLEQINDHVRRRLAGHAALAVAPMTPRPPAELVERNHPIKDLTAAMIQLNATMALSVEATDRNTEAMHRNTEAIEKAWEIHDRADEWKGDTDVG
jgi:hypothetical protein